MRCLLLLLLLVAGSCFGSQCDELYPNKIAIVIPQTNEVCKSFFVVVLDSVNKRPLFSSEYYVPSDNKVERDTRFYNNPLYNIDVSRYPKGFDRGHLTPAADSATGSQMHDTFDVINTAPQNPKLNRGEWRRLEQRLRDDREVVWIITGVIYGSDQLIPTHFYKVVYRPGYPGIGYISDNSATGGPMMIPVEQLSQKVGFDLNFR